MTMEYLPLDEALRDSVEAHISYTHTQVAQWKITGYRLELESPYDHCACSSGSGRRELKIDYEITTKRGAVRTGSTRISGYDLEELIEQAIRSLIK